jgi:predicted flap endonuclease-1-like 5' DNA nuclease
MLIGPDGRWRDDLWLDDRIAVAAPEDPSESGDPPGLAAPLPINTCSRDSLILLPGVGPVLAGRIDDVRRQGVCFLTPADLQQVKGIGPTLASRLESLVVFLPAEESLADIQAGNSEPPPDAEPPIAPH